MHNGRFCITPEYPNGTYAYFCTVDANWNSAYPYVVGPTFYGVSANRKVTSVTETTTIYSISTSVTDNAFDNLNITVFPNPASDLIAVQINDLTSSDFILQLFDMTGKKVAENTINKGSTISYIDTQSLYSGNYTLKITSDQKSIVKQVVIAKP